MQNTEAAEGDEQGEKRDYDDAGGGSEVAIGDSRETLPANHAHDDEEARECSDVEQDDNGDRIAAEAESSLDHLPHARLRAHGAKVRRSNGGQEGEEDDDEGAVSQTEVVDGWTQQAKRDSV